MKRLVSYTIVVLATVGILLLLWTFRAILLAFLLSLFLAAAIRPLILRLSRVGLPPVVAQILVYLAGIALLTLVFSIGGARLLGELEVLSNRIVRTYETSYAGWTDGTALQQAVASRLLPPTQLYDAIGGEEGELLLERLSGITTSIATVAAGVAMVVVLSVYWMADQAHFERLWLSLLPSGRRVAARDSWRAVEAAVGAYLRSELTQAFLAGVLLALGFGALDFPFPVTMALLAAIAWTVPLVGGVVIVLMVGVAGLFTGTAALVAGVLYTLAVLGLLEFVVEPVFFERSRYSSLLIIITMLVLVDALGVVGFIAALPVAAAIQVGLQQVFTYRVHARTEAVHAEALQARLETLREQVQNGSEAPAPEVTSLLDRLENLIHEAREVAR